MSPKDPVEKILDNEYGDKIPSLPIDPYKLMSNYGIIYQFMRFEKIEGIYLVPDDDSDVAFGYQLQKKNH